jgi:hypothetical protein
MKNLLVLAICTFLTSSFATVAIGAADNLEHCSPTLLKQIVTPSADLRGCLISSELVPNQKTIVLLEIFPEDSSDSPLAGVTITLFDVKNPETKFFQDTGYGEEVSPFLLDGKKTILGIKDINGDGKLEFIFHTEQGIGAGHLVIRSYNNQNQSFEPISVPNKDPSKSLDTELISTNHGSGLPQIISNKEIRIPTQNKVIIIKLR